MPVSTKKFDPSYVWDGQLFKYHLSTEPLHDLAHWQLCGDERRSVVEFGLGNSPDAAHLANCPRLATPAVSYFEERCASILGLLWERTLSADLFRRTWSKHGWAIDNLDIDQHPITVLSKLMAGGYVDGKLVPTKKVGKVSITDEVGLGE